MSICWSEEKWYAVQAKQFGENFAAGYLTRLGIRTFLPQTREEHNVCGTDRVFVKPLFSGYFFTFFDLRSRMMRCDTRASVTGLGNGLGPLPVPEEIIEGIRSRVQADGFVKLERAEPRCGDKVALTRGCLAGWMGSR